MLQTLIFLSYFALLGSKGQASPLARTVQGKILINDPSWAPYFFAGDKKAPPGLVKEVLTLCLQREGLDFEFRHMAIERMQVAIEEGKLDINFFSFKPERTRFLDYGSEPLFVATYRPIIRADSSIQIDRLSDFDRYRLGHTIGMRYSKEFYDYVMNRKELNTLDETATNESNLLKLVHNRIDIFVATEDAVFYLADNLQLRSQIRIVPFDIQSASYTISVSKKSPRILDKKLFLSTMDQCFKELKKDGTYCRVSQTYKMPCLPKQ